MTSPTTPNVAAGPRFSNGWAAVAVARRLVHRYTAPIAGRVVAARLDRTQGSAHPAWAFRWIYWLTVLREIEKRCGYRFPVAEAPNVAHQRALPPRAVA